MPGVTEIDLREIKRVVDGLLDHAIKEVGVDKLMVDSEEDFYWSCPLRGRYDTSKQPSEWWTGRLSDDLDFLRSTLRHEAYVVYTLVHAAPVLRYIAERVKEFRNSDNQ